MIMHSFTTTKEFIYYPPLYQAALIPQHVSGDGCSLEISDYTIWPKDGNVAVLNSK